MNPGNRDEEEQLTAQKSTLLKRRYSDTRLSRELDRTTGMIKVEEMERLRVVPLSHSSFKVELGFTDKTKKSALDELKQRFPQFNLEFSLVSNSGYQEILDRYYGASQKVNPRAYKELALQDQLKQARQQDLFLRIAQQAYDRGASDIHIEPLEGQVLVRFRIDGVLHPAATLEYKPYNILLSDLQTHAGIKWNVDYPQTGRVRAGLEGKNQRRVAVDMRVETIPTMHGTDVVIRIFSLEVEYLSLDNLGLTEAQKALIVKLIIHPHGMVLTVGPTGSGKTSTQYSIINRLNKPDVKIVTLEDPVEYELPGVTQIPVYTIDQESFLEKFRGVLREDPDIIMLGEIRDTDTAKTALQAALTGHLVLSTFHAASSSAAISRLMDMIGQNPLLASAIRLIIAQRLVRKLCQNCKEPYPATTEELETFRTKLANLPETARPELDHITLYRAIGCEACHKIGYKGRVMVLEQLPMTPEVEKFIGGSVSGTTTDKIEELAVSEGMITLMQDALLKVLQGITSLEEVFRVIA